MSSSESGSAASAGETHNGRRDDGRHLVEVMQTSLVPVDSKAVLGARLLQPRRDAEVSAGGTGETYSLVFEGWVVPREDQGVTIELTYHGDTVTRIPVDRRRDDLAVDFLGVPHAEQCGFLARVNMLPFPPEFDLVVEAVLADETRVTIATVRGRRAKLGSRYEPSLQPLLVTSLGRSGSTAMMQVLAAHPQVATHGESVTESNLVSYWADVLMTLSEPSSLQAQVWAIQHQAYRGWSADLYRLGKETPARTEDEMLQLAATTGVEELAAFCQSRIDAFYRTVADRAGKADAICFAEKSRPDPINSVNRLLDALYPDAREIVLVRDFRDVFCSWRAFAIRRGLTNPGVVTDEDRIQFRAARAAEMLGHWQKRSGQAHLVRYEDLIMRPVQTVQRLLRYLNLDAAPETVETLANAVRTRPPELKDHVTSPTAQASIGRWREELEPAMQRFCTESFRPALKGFGYPV